MKTCTACGIEKLLVEFSPRNDTKNGLHSRCKDCLNDYRRKYYKNNPSIWRNRHLVSKYNITHEEWDQLLESQNNVCALCGKDSPQTLLGWQTDHNHNTGKLRGLLCLPCNIFVGHIEQSEWEPPPIEAVYDYLTR